MSSRENFRPIPSCRGYTDFTKESWFTPIYRKPKPLIIVPKGKSSRCSNGVSSAKRK